MVRNRKPRAAWLVVVAGLCGLMAGLTQSRMGQAAPSGGDYLSPLYMALSPDGERLYVTEHTAGRLDVVDVRGGRVETSVEVPAAPSGVAVSPDGAKVYVASAEEDVVAVVDAERNRVTGKIKVGVHPWGLTLSPDGKTLYVCNRFTDDVSVVDVAKGAETARIPVVHEPSFSAVSEPTSTLVVANMIPLSSDHDFTLASEISFVDLNEGKQVATVRLPSGCNQAMGVAISPDGEWAYVVHLLGRFLVPTTQIQRGWINTNALSVINVRERKLLATVLIDDLDLGAANPQCVALTRDGKQLYISLRGTHQVMRIDVDGLHRIITETPEDKRPELANDLTFLYRNGVKERFSAEGRGPGGIALSADESDLYVANYYSDTVTALKARTGKLAKTVALGKTPEPDLIRRGEMLFFDADLCFQKWQSCGSCHPDARSDGLMWDLLNDGLGNPKNTKSMLLADKTPPSMSSGIRSDARIAAEAGVRYINFRQPEEADVDALYAYISSLTPEKAPILREGGEEAKKRVERGKKLFEDEDRTGCTDCHPAPLYTNLEMADVGTRSQFDRRDDFDTPSLVEVYRTGPYLHDGTAVTLRDVVTTHNPDDRHGRTSDLSEEEIDDLVAFLESL
jgi:YVTN family beta-propeller protein